LMTEGIRIRIWRPKTIHYTDPDPDPEYCKT
jgi:hypothetical protein